MGHTAAVIEDLPGRYHEYLERFAQQLGELPAGAFAKYNGRLIKKLTFEEFTPAYLEYIEMCAQYEESVARGDTLNDLVLRILHEKGSNLVLAPPPE